MAYDGDWWGIGGFDAQTGPVCTGSWNTNPSLDTRSVERSYLVYQVPAPFCKEIYFSHDYDEGYRTVCGQNPYDSATGKMVPNLYWPHGYINSGTVLRVRLRPATSTFAGASIDCDAPGYRSYANMTNFTEWDLPWLNGTPFNYSDFITPV
jgi:hypothetical protein